MLPPGVWSIANGTGQPEAVLTNQQWRDVHAIATNGARGPTYHIQYKEAVLDWGRLRSLQDREDARNRVGRAH
jgi:hypothetical protein